MMRSKQIAGFVKEKNTLRVDLFLFADFFTDSTMGFITMKSHNLGEYVFIFLTILSKSETGEYWIYPPNQ